MTGSGVSCSPSASHAPTYVIAATLSVLLKAVSVLAREYVAPGAEKPGSQTVASGSGATVKAPSPIFSTGMRVRVRITSTV
ncbi:MAG: hypothetical protein IPF66_22185 [Holophagales bacterium]|nr:hypothetical protein [Holophagales bacterium]